MSQSPIPDEQQGVHGSLGLPDDNGWAALDDGPCSVTHCAESPVAAVLRAGGARRPAHWQAYCASHARARGVEKVDGQLVWTEEFLTPKRPW